MELVNKHVPAAMHRCSFYAKAMKKISGSYTVLENSTAGYGTEVMG